MCPRTCALGLSSSLLSENKKKTTKVCEIGDRESYFGALFILWIHGKNSHIRTTCKLGGHDLIKKKKKKKKQKQTSLSFYPFAIPKTLGRNKWREREKREKRQNLPRFSRIFLIVIVFKCSTIPIKQSEIETKNWETNLY